MSQAIARLPGATGRWLAPIHLTNDASGLAIHSVNAASAAHLSQIGNDAGASTASQSSNLQGLRYAQAECKEASTAAQSGEMQGKASLLHFSRKVMLHGIARGGAA